MSTYKYGWLLTSSPAWPQLRSLLSLPTPPLVMQLFSNSALSHTPVGFWILILSGRAEMNEIQLHSGFTKAELSNW